MRRLEYPGAILFAAVDLDEFAGQFWEIAVFEPIDNFGETTALPDFLSPSAFGYQLDRLRAASRQ